MLGIFQILIDHLFMRDLTIKPNWIFQTKNKSYSFVILGSSRAYTSTDAATLTQTLGKSSLNLGLNGASFSELDMIFQKYLQYNSANNLLLEVDINGLDSTEFKYPFQQYNYLPYLSDSLVFSHIKNYFGLKAYLWKYLPFYKYIEFNTQSGVYTAVRVLMKHSQEYDPTGTHLLDQQYFDPVIDHQPAKNYEVSRNRLCSLIKILETAREKKITTVLYIAPQYIALRSKQINRDEILEIYRSLAKRYDAKFYVFDNPIFENDQSLFKDASHVNMKGARKFSAEFGRWLKQQLLPL